MIGLKTLYIQSTLKRSFQHATYITFLIFSVLLILEICYRNQIIDFYKTELEGLNSAEELSENGSKTLIIGDSFSAHPESYVKVLKDSLNTKDHKIINASVPGIGIKQQAIILDKRLRQFNAKNVIIQVYLGNDLIDYSYPISWKNQSLARNVYWMLGDVFLVVPYINSRLKPLANNQHTPSNGASSFSVENYHNSSKLYLKSSENLYNDMFALKGDWMDIYNDWRDKMQEVFEDHPAINFTLLVFPHCAQTHDLYRDRFKDLGASFTDDLRTINAQIKKDFSNIKLIDLTEFIIEQEHSGVRMYYDNDPHLNTSAQQLIGKYLLNEL